MVEKETPPNQVGILTARDLTERDAGYFSTDIAPDPCWLRELEEKRVRDQWIIGLFTWDTGLECMRINDSMAVAVDHGTRCPRWPS